MLLANFQPYVATEVIGCPDPTLNQAIVMAAIEFCRESQSWTETLDPVTLVNGTRDYELDVPMNAYLYTVRDVWVGSRRLSPALQSDVSRDETGSEPSTYNMAADRTMLSVYPVPAAVMGASLVVRATFTPTASATTLPDYLGHRYMDAVTSGAKARLMAMPGVPWSNPQLAVYYKSVLDAAVITARIEEAHDRVPGTIFVKPRSFGF